MSTKKYAIVGMGLSGRAALRLIRQFETTAEVKTFDASTDKGADYSDPAKLLSEFAPDTLVVSPGVPLSTPWIRDFIAQGGKVTGELDLAWHCLAGEKCLGITGSLGKSTTVSLVEAGIKAFDPNGVATGNIGYPVADYVCDVATGKRPRAQWLVVELSSYQLENLRDFRFEFSAITYLSENHLDRYPSINDYFASKWHLANLTQGICVLNDNGGDLTAYFKSHPSNKFRLASQSAGLLGLQDFKSAQLIGAHNRDNMQMAQALFNLAGFPKSATQAMLAYRGLAHRLEPVGDFGGRIFINDSKATTMESVLTAYAATRESYPAARIFLLLGGKDKNLPWAKLNALNSEANLTPVFFGKCGELARDTAKLSGDRFDHLSQAVQSLLNSTQSGDVVLLSPGGSSLDEFKNFEERGRVFAELASKTFSGVK